VLYSGCFCCTAGATKFKAKFCKLRHIIYLATLDEVKSFAIGFLKKEIDMLQMISTLDRNEIQEFNNWYKNNEYYNHLQDLVQLVHQTKLMS
jgi:hypothetical protein